MTELTQADRSNIAAEMAGIIVGRLFRFILIPAFILFLIGAAYGAGANSQKVEPVKVEQVKKKPAKIVKHKKHKKAKKNCACHCKK